MKFRILLVDDAPDVRTIVEKALPGDSCEIVSALTAADALAQLKKSKFHLVLLDVGLPDTDGFMLFMEMQKGSSNRKRPVIFLTGESGVREKVAAFSMGAEDYIVKPFHPLEFRARVMAKLEKIKRREEEREVFSSGGLQFDLGLQKVYEEEADNANGETKKRDLGLTPKEFKILYHLARQPSRVFTRDRLLDAVWGNDVSVYDRTVDAHICTIRRKMSGRANQVESVPGVGYRFNPPGQA